MRHAAWLAAWPAGVALGAASAVVARTDPDYAFAATGGAVAVELVAGYALIACGLIAYRRGPGRRFATLLVAGGAAWFLLEWNNPGADSAAVFTVGLVLYAAAPPVIAHALLVYPGRALDHVERAVLALAYGGSVLALGLLSAVVFDPAGQGCSGCPRNLVLITPRPGLYQALNRAGVYAGLVWTLLMLGLTGWRLARSSPAVRRLVTPVLAAGCAYIGLVSADFATSVGRGYLFSGSLDRHLWLAEAAALVVLTLGVAWTWLRGRRIRARLTRLVVELAAAPSPGDLEHALAQALGDPDLRLAYPIADGRYVTASGAEYAPGPTATPLVRDGVEVAVLAHRPGLLDDPGLVNELAASARLALEHERLRAQLLARLAELRTSRARIVTTGDAARRRLERDLHDGAQQQLVALALALRVARVRLEGDHQADHTIIASIEQAEDELRAALAGLRKLATGIFPSALADEGLAAAVEVLAEEKLGRLRITDLPEERFAPAIETAAYHVVAETLKEAGTHPVRLTVVAAGSNLVLDLVSEHPPAELTELEDRLGALDGTITVAWPDGGSASIHAEIPCAS